MCLPSIHYIHGIFRHHFHFLKQGSLCARAKETAFNCLVAAVSDHVMRITPCGTKTFETVDGTWMWPRKKPWIGRGNIMLLAKFMSTIMQLSGSKNGKTEWPTISPSLGGSELQRKRSTGFRDKTRGGLDAAPVGTVFGAKTG